LGGVGIGGRKGGAPNYFCLGPLVPEGRKGPERGLGNYSWAPLRGRIKGFIPIIVWGGLGL